MRSHVRQPDGLFKRGNWSQIKASRSSPPVSNGGHRVRAVSAIREGRHCRNVAEWDSAINPRKNKAPKTNGSTVVLIFFFEIFHRDVALLMALCHRGRLQDGTIQPVCESQQCRLDSSLRALFILFKLQLLLSQLYASFEESSKKVWVWSYSPFYSHHAFDTGSLCF